MKFSVSSEERNYHRTCISLSRLGFHYLYIYWKTCTIFITFGCPVLFCSREQGTETKATSVIDVWDLLCGMFQSWRFFFYLGHHGESLVNCITKNCIQNEDKICWVWQLPVLSSGRSGEDGSAVAVMSHSVVEQSICGALCCEYRKYPISVYYIVYLR